MASTAFRSKWIAGLTVGLGMWACFGPGASDGSGGVPAGEPAAGEPTAREPGSGEHPAGTGGTGYGTGGTSGGCGAGGESGSGDSGLSGAGGGVVLPPPLAACPDTPDAPDAVLVRVPAVLPEGAFGSQVNAVSADGNTVVGTYAVPLFPEQPSLGIRLFAFRWSVGAGLETLDAPGAEYSYAYAVSADGSVVVGSLHRPDTIGERAVVWTSAGLRELEPLPDATAGMAAAVSADGSVIVGVQQFIEYVPQQRWAPVRWTASGIEVLDHPLPNGASVANASADGRVVVGGPLGGSTALRWDGSGPAQVLSVPDASSADAGGVSGDGSVVVGWASLPGRTAPVRWDGERAELLEFAAGEFSATAQAMGADADGSVIVGVFEGQAAIWERAHGMRRLATVLAGLGVDVSPWHFDAVRSISADGRVIAGSGICGDAGRGFIVRLPAEPGADADAGATMPDAGATDGGS
ncbi:MAG TPA: hypothetical protein VMG12_29150 [Polyangiaceae bacterium]|nr:hypothetical protein [Polyangiaceae bacterium]